MLRRDFADFGFRYRTLLSDGKKHIIVDTCLMADNSASTAVFNSLEPTFYDKFIEWDRELDTHYLKTASESEMLEMHRKMVDKWEKLLNDKKGETSK